jgi:hypothetical protein
MSLILGPCLEVSHPNLSVYSRTWKKKKKFFGLGITDINQFGWRHLVNTPHENHIHSYIIQLLATMIYPK